MFNKLKLSLIAVPVLSISILSPSLAQAQLPPICVSFAGSVRLDVDPTCKINSLYSGPAYLSQYGIPNSCFTVQLTGLMGLAKGYAGLTSESAISSTGGMASTPLFMNESGINAEQNELGILETRRFFTARTVISMPGGNIYTSDAGVMAGVMSNEQLIIIGGDGLFSNAKGVFNASGKILGNWGNYTGQMCLPLR